jgi:S-adenosylmethionine decarboxylase
MLVFHLAPWLPALAGYGQALVTPRHQPVLYSVDLKDCRRLAALSPEAATAAFTSALTSAGATVVQATSHNFPGSGLTSVLILSESHAVLHTWPETGTVNIDIFSCSPRLKSLSAIAALAETLGASSTSIQEVQRADGHSQPADQQR